MIVQVTLAAGVTVESGGNWVPPNRIEQYRNSSDRPTLQANSRVTWVFA